MSLAAFDNCTIQPGKLNMNRKFLSALAILAGALSPAFAGDAEANNCNPPVGAFEEIVAWACGENLSAQLGDGTGAVRVTPVQVRNLGEVTAIAGGIVHSLALKKDCTVWAWGTNVDGQLGDGTSIKRFFPVRVSHLSGLSGATAIAAGQFHSLALKTDGTVWAGAETPLASWVTGPPPPALSRCR